MDIYFLLTGRFLSHSNLENTLGHKNAKATFAFVSKYGIKQKRMNLIVFFFCMIENVTKNGNSKNIKSFFRCLKGN